MLIARGLYVNLVLVGLRNRWARDRDRGYGGKRRAWRSEFLHRRLPRERDKRSHRHRDTRAKKTGQQHSGLSLHTQTVASCRNSTLRRTYNTPAEHEIEGARLMFERAE
jgi:hypothetical protein